MKLYSNTKHNSLLNLFTELFEAKPKISTIVINDKCSDCGREIIIEITPTPVGFGLMGGALFESSNDKFKAKCLACYEKHYKIDNNQKSGK